MIKYWIMKRKMKRDEVMVKAMLYGMIANIIENQKDVIELIQKLYVTLKDVSVDDLQKEFVHALAEIIHGQNQSNETEKDSMN